MARLRILAATLALLAVPAVASAPAGSPLPPPLDLLGAPPELEALDRPVAQSILGLIRRVNPQVPRPRAAALAATIVTAAAARELDPLLLAGIVAQESRFRASTQACLGRGCDLGVGQVNWETWGAALRLDRLRLIHDDGYNLGVAAGILADLRQRHGAEGRRWWTRYHDRREDRRVAYAARVKANAPVLLGAL